MLERLERMQNGNMVLLWCVDFAEKSEPAPTGIGGKAEAI
jgi:hypothetical protein